MIRIAVVAASVVAAATFTSAHAQSPLPFDPARPLAGIVRPDDVEVFFDYLRDAYGAVLDGQEMPSGDAARARAEAIGHELKLRARVGGVVLLNALERTLKGVVEDAERGEALPPAAPLRL